VEPVASASAIDLNEPLARVLRALLAPTEH
jgi:hypothetical protein